MDDNTIDLGHDHTARLFTADGADGETIGLTLFHPHGGRGFKMPDGAACAGTVIFDVPAARESYAGLPRWQVESMDPLTISPSVACSCGDHGFIRDGKWVPA